MAPTSRKAITSITPNEAPAHQVRFAPHLFNELVSDKGYDVWHDKALQCPCSVKNAGQPLPNCDNCLGTAWFFVNRSETRMVVQGMKADVRFENWTRDTAGMARVTSRAVDKLAFMDRIILKDVEGYYNEILRTKIKDGRKVLYTMYEVIEVESIYMFVEAKQKLKEEADKKVKELEQKAKEEADKKAKEVLKDKIPSSLKNIFGGSKDTTKKQ